MQDRKFGRHLHCCRIDRLDRDAARVMLMIKLLGDKGISIRSLCEGIDIPNATGRSGEAVPTIAVALDESRATIYRTLNEWVG